MEYIPNFWVIYLVSAILTFVGGMWGEGNRPMYRYEMYFLIALTLLPVVNTLAAAMFSVVLIFKAIVWSFERLLGIFNITVR